MKQYVRPAVFVEAAQVTDEASAKGISIWCGGEVRTEAKASDHTDVAVWVVVPTLQGRQLAYHNKWVVKGRDGKFSIMDDSEFTAIYQLPMRTPRGMREEL